MSWAIMDVPPRVGRLDTRHPRRLFSPGQVPPGYHALFMTSPQLNSVNDLVENQFLVVSGDYMVWVDAEEEMRVVDAMEGEPRRFA